MVDVTTFDDVLADISRNVYICSMCGAVRRKKIPE
jgi:hypothetical protein